MQKIKGITQDLINNKTNMSNFINAAESQAVTRIVASLLKSKSKKAKRQSMILENDNPYLKNRAENIKKLSENMNQLNTTKKNKTQIPTIKKKDS